MALWCNVYIIPELRDFEVSGWHVRGSQISMGTCLTILPLLLGSCTRRSSCHSILQNPVAEHTDIPWSR